MMDEKFVTAIEAGKELEIATRDMEVMEEIAADPRTSDAFARVRTAPLLTLKGFSAQSNIVTVVRERELTDTQ